MSDKKLNKSDLLKLYKEAGREEGIETLLTCFYEKMAADTMLGFFFFNRDLSHIVKMQKFFLLKAMGINSSYDGKPPATAHKALPPILRGHFDRRLVLLRETLTEGGLSAEGTETWIFFENQFRKLIVNK